MLNLEGLRGLDRELAALAVGEAALRLRLGQALEVLGGGGHHDLGFSSLGAYALERCERSVRWVEGARCMARRLEGLPRLRRAVALGVISWSKGEVLGRVARPEDEAAWLEAAQGCTVRALRERVKAAKGQARAGGSVAGNSHAASAANDALEEEEVRTLSCTVDREDAWLFEATRTLLAQLGTREESEQIEALLAEGQGTLLGALPRGAIDAERFEGAALGELQRRYNEELARWRAEAELRCEEWIVGSRSGGEGRGSAGSVAVGAALGSNSLSAGTSRELDRVVRDLSRRLASQELEFSRGFLQLHRANGWRRLGYATEGQYARERLGMSASSLLAKRALALRLESLPGVADALGTGRIGVEAALQVARVATRGTEGAWVERARQRTIKHFREEVAAALVAVRLSGERECPPPVDSELSAFQGLERAVLRGGLGAELGEEGMGEPAEPNGEHQSAHGGRRAWGVMLGSLAAWLRAGFQTSAGRQEPSQREVSSAGRVELRLRVSRETYEWWRGLELQAAPWLPRGMSWVKFLCLALWRAWRHVVGASVAYGEIYVRDRWRCTSPVCNRQDVTPHHLRFRAAGGSDEAANVAAVCTWCHLFGVHGGRIRARGTADCIDWELGPIDEPCVVVHGRERVAA